jgi:hypothetical protein
MKIDMNEAYVYETRTITPLNEVDCTRDVEKRPPNERLTQRRVIDCAANTYSAEQRVFIVRKYWRTDSFKQCQRAFRNKCGEGSVRTKFSIHRPRNTLYPLKLTLASLTGGDRSIGIVRLRTKTTEFFFCDECLGFLARESPCSFRNWQRREISHKKLSIPKLVQFHEP